MRWQRGLGRGWGADLTVLGPEVQSRQEEGGERRLLSVQLFFFHVGDVLPQDDHQRPQLSLWGAAVQMENVKVHVALQPNQTKTLPRPGSRDQTIKQ